VFRDITSSTAATCECGNSKPSISIFLSFLSIVNAGIDDFVVEDESGVAAPGEVSVQSEQALHASDAICLFNSSRNREWAHHFT
jgi:hypothetical protein